MPDSFVHLHVHTEYSMLDGAAKISPLFAEAQRLEMPAIAMTDHGNMYAAAEFYRQSQKTSVKPIIGIEAYLAPASRHHKKPMFWGQANQRGTDEYGEGGDVSGAGAYTHMTMLAANATGLRNLFKLSSRASFEGYYRKPRCLLPGQEIMTRGGMKRIEDVRVGDEVLTHLGRFRPVVERMCNFHEGNIYGIQLGGRYNRVTWMTGEHPVLIRKRDGSREWVDARDILPGRPGTGTREEAEYWNSWVCLPRVHSDAPLISSIHTATYISWSPVEGQDDQFVRISNRRNCGPTRHYGNLRGEIELDFDFGYFVGLYVAEGRIDRGRTVTWSFHEDELALIDTVSKLVKIYTGKTPRVRKRPDRAAYRGVDVSVGSTVLAQLLTALCGTGASRKHLPSIVFDAPESFMRGAFQGVLDGDGSATRTDVVSLQQTSEQLHWQMRTVAARLNSDFVSTYPQTPKSPSHAQSYRANFSPERLPEHRRTLSDDSFVYKPVKDVLQKKYTGYVYNIAVADDHTYVTDFAVHNCDRELISEYAQGILATTGCPSGEVQTRLRLGQPAEALQAAADYRDIFGAGNFFLELMDHGLPIERSVREGLLEIGRTLNLRPLATNDSHYVTQDQADAHSALLCVGTGKTLDDPHRFKFEGDGYYLKSAAEMREYWDREVPGAADTTLLIAERIEPYDEVFAEVNRMPRFPLAEGETEDLLLRREVEHYTPTRFPDGLTPEYQERIETELRVISQMGFPGYFLVVGDLVRWAKSQKIAVGPGRGSATGSLVSYILHITDLDPIEHSLIFERFLNPERISPPDIDLDFDERRRGEVLDYTVNKWGAENVAQVITFGTIKTKAALKDAARVLHGQPGFSIADRISKALPPPVFAKDIPLSGIFDPQHERYAEAAEIRALTESDPQVAKIVDTARGLEGLTRNAGVHACAVILSAQPLLDVIPLWQRDDGSIITGWDFPACEAIGLLKMDFLGLRTLTVIDDTIKEVRANHGVDVDLATMPLDDRATYELLGRGDTLGVFQLDGAAMRDLLRRMQPKHFGDIAAVLALYRPGPMAANAHIDYAERSNGRQKIKPIHPELREALEPILGETYHLLVYQEQVMAIAQRLAGYSLGGADLLRRAMGKKKKEIIEKEFERFRAGMTGSGFSVEATQTLWDVMLPFAGYAFNKSHTAGYGLVSYWTAYLKANYPAEFMAAQLTSIGDNKDKSAIYLAECRRMGIKVLPPDVNDSGLYFAAVGADIRFGLGAIRNVGANVVQSIITTREQKGRFTSFADFLEKVELVCCNKRTIESLIKAGSFDSFSHTRLSLVRVHEEAVDAVTGLKRQEALGQFDLFGFNTGASNTSDTSPLAHLVLRGEEWPSKELLRYEREMLGLYVSAHPLDGAERVLRQHAPKSIAAVLDEAPKDGEIVVSGMISTVDRRVNKQGEPWAIVTVEDLDASIEILFFAKAYSILHEDLVADTAVAIKGRVNWREDKMSVFGLEVIQLDVGSAEHHAAPILPFVLRADAVKLDQDVARELRNTLAAHKGDTPVHLVLCNNGRETALALNDYPVTVGSSLVGELKAISGITVAS